MYPLRKVYSLGFIRNTNKGSVRGKIWVRMRNNTAGMFMIRIGYSDLILPICVCIYHALEALARKLMFGIMVCFSLCEGAILYAPTSTRSNKQRVTICETSRGSTYIGEHDAYHTTPAFLLDPQTSTQILSLWTTIRVRFAPWSQPSQPPMPAMEMAATDSVHARMSVQFW